MADVHQIVDARGQSCPIPVVMTKKVLKDKPAELRVLVDNACSLENVTRFGENNGYAVTSSAQDGDAFEILLVRK